MIGYYNYTVWLTYTSLVSGTCGIYFAFSGHPLSAVICLLLSGFCDMFDGKVARTKADRTEKEKSYGIQIDSLTDMVCFGVLPAAIGYSIGMTKLWCMPILALFVLCGMIRLSYYNVLEIERQNVEEGNNKFFWGLPITMASIIFPAIYCFKDLLGSNLYIVYAIFMFIISLLFVLKIKVPKLGIVYSVFVACVGVFMIIYMVAGRK